MGKEGIVGKVGKAGKAGKVGDNRMLKQRIGSPLT